MTEFTSRIAPRIAAKPAFFSTLLACALAHAQSAPPAARGAIRLGSDDPDSIYYQPEGEPSTEETATTPESVTVQPGDAHLVSGGETLWSLALRFLGSADLWPKLWSYNPHITNPHYIYPGETVYLGPSATTIAVATIQPPEVPAEPDTGAPGPRQLSDDTPSLRTAARLPPDLLFLRQHGFLEERELREAGRLVASKEQKQMLATLDEAYVQLP